MLLGPASLNDETTSCQVRALASHWKAVGPFLGRFTTIVWLCFVPAETDIRDSVCEGQKRASDGSIDLEANRVCAAQPRRASWTHPAAASCKHANDRHNIEDAAQAGEASNGSASRVTLAAAPAQPALRTA